jgi:hypothetical protein
VLAAEAATRVANLATLRYASEDTLAHNLY